MMVDEKVFGNSDRVAIFSYGLKDPERERGGETSSPRRPVLGSEVRPVSRQLWGTDWLTEMKGLEMGELT